MSLQQKFDEAADKVKNLSKKPKDDELLELYGLFKQATVGDNNTPKPGMLDMKGKYKWEAWEKRKGMSKEQAMEAYVTKAGEIIAKYA